MKTLFSNNSLSLRRKPTKFIALATLTLSLVGSVVLTSIHADAQTSPIMIKPESFILVNASGQAKTSFQPNELIYVKATISNRGTAIGATGITTQFFKHQPQAAPNNSKDSPEFSLLHGAFHPTPATNPNLYQSTPGHSSLNRFATTTRSFSQSTPGTYTARIFVDPTNVEPRDDKTDNQMTTTYTIAGATPTPPPSNPTPTPSPVIIPQTVNSGVNLVVDSFVLTNASGTVKTTFAPGEAIYIKSAIRNSGTVSSKTGSVTQYYANQASTSAVGTKNNPEISTTHGIFDPTNTSNPYVYESRPNGSRVAQFTSTKYFSQTTPGTYTARVFADANNTQGEPNETDNQKTVTYTISAPSPTTPPPTNPAPVQGYDQVRLVPESFNLTNASGQVKTSFAANEPIYIQTTIANRGTLLGVENIMTQIYKNSPQAASLNTKDSPEFALIHGPFGVTAANTTNLYQSTPGHFSLNRFYGSTRYFTQATPGTYTARIFVDASNREPRDNKADNQRTVTYTVTAASTTPPPTNPWPANTVWPQPVQNLTSLQMIVNKKFRLPSDFVPANLRTVNIPLINNQPLRNDTATALEQMNSDALKSGIRMHLRSGYRSYWTQDTLYNNYVAQYGRASADTFSARPGHSEHQTGLAFDLGDRDVPSCDLAECFATTKSGKFVAQNAHRYGFIIRYPKGKDSITGYTYEPWHLRHVGVSEATAIFTSGKTMEEYYNVPGGGY